MLVQGATTGKWSFPKGHMEGAETAQGCALRELFEETGIVLSDFVELGYKKFSRDGGGYFIYMVAKEFTIEPSNYNEIIKGGWFSEKEMRSLSCNKDVNSFLALL
jgi:8-oxo-dGTP pyrophosphatase MutT (NUDIX family)